MRCVASSPVVYVCIVVGWIPLLSWCASVERNIQIAGIVPRTDNQAFSLGPFSSGRSSPLVVVVVHKPVPSQYALVLYVCSPLVSVCVLLLSILVSPCRL
jgi:hypothetical protein